MHLKGQYTCIYLRKVILSGIPHFIDMHVASEMSPHSLLIFGKSDLVFFRQKGRFELFVKKMKLFSFIAATAFSLDLNGVWVNRDGDLYQFDEEKLFIIGNDNSVQQTSFSTIEVNGISILMFTDRGNRRGGTIDETTETINFGAGKGLNK